MGGSDTDEIVGSLDLMDATCLKEAEEPHFNAACPR